jgi:hypothetical protein
MNDPTPGAAAGNRVVGIHYDHRVNLAFGYDHTLRFGDEIWLRARLYLPTPPADVNQNRKLIDFQGPNGQRSILHAWGHELRYTATYNGVEDTESGHSHANRATGIQIPFDQWITLEVHHKINSAPGVRDGVLEIYVNGEPTPSLRWTDMMWPNTGYYFNWLEIGSQVNNGGLDEWRYWDDVAFSTKRIGP